MLEGRSIPPCIELNKEDSLSGSALVVLVDALRMQERPHPKHINDEDGVRIEFSDQDNYKDAITIQEHRTKGHTRWYRVGIQTDDGTYSIIADGSRFIGPKKHYSSINLVRTDKSCPEKPIDSRARVMMRGVIENVLTYHPKNIESTFLEFATRQIMNGNGMPNESSFLLNKR